jgi:preprotein translocase subunit SecY
MVIPQFKEWSEQGETGKQKLNRVTRYSAIVLAFLQAFALIVGISINGSVLRLDLEPSLITQYRYFFYIYMALVMTAGTGLAIWLGDLITKKGIGNGTSMLIVAGIVTSLPPMWTTLWTKYISSTNKNWLGYCMVYCYYLALLWYFIWCCLYANCN